jgi:hypothetical protein
MARKGKSMKKWMNRALVGWLPLALVAATACSGNEDNGNNNGPDPEPDVVIGENATPGPDAGENNGEDNNGQDNNGQDNNGENNAVDNNVDPLPQPIWDGTPVESCDELEGSVECFSNFDCHGTQVCKDIGWPCCVVGERGTKQAGEACDPDTGETECDTAICVQGDVDGNEVSLCSKTCQTADDCPEGMKRCQPIAFSGSMDSWCFPAAGE